MRLFRRCLFVIGVLLVVASAITWATTSYLNSNQRGKTLVYSNNAQLLELWNNYKKVMIEPSSNRTYDKTQGNITTSEGQSYTMLRAAWMDDRTTFDKSWAFTRDNMQRSDDLFSWKYGQKADGSYGVLTDVGGNNTAADADTDIALSLLMAYQRWNDTSYLDAAQPIINSIWEQEVVLIQNKPVMTADNLEKDNPNSVLINPSYFAPYSYRLFAQVDNRHDWMGLLNNSYDIISNVSSSPLDKPLSTGMPPNWAIMNRQTGQFSAATSTNIDTNYGYDAFRLPWRLALDYQWYKDSRDTDLLNSFSFLKNQWQQSGKLATVYSHDGKVIGNYESPAMYGASMGYFSIADKDDANIVYSRKLESLYSPDRQNWKNQLNYYDDNWAWFGIALTQNALPNLAENH